MEVRSVPHFPEPLRPTPGESSQQETTALAKAINSYLAQTDTEETRALEQFLSSYPNSRWAATLQLNIGLISYNTGHFGRSLRAFLLSWQASKDGTDQASRDISQRAIAEYAKMNARVGRMEELERVFREITGRSFEGQARSVLDGAIEGYSMMTSKPGVSFRCGPYALLNVARAAGSDLGKDKIVDFLDSAQSPRKGFSLLELSRMSKDLGLSLQLAFRSPGAPLVTPAVVHWAVDHYAALVLETGDKYLIQDPTFGNEVWMTRSAIDSEASGYFLVPSGTLPPGWRQATEQEAAGVFGKGHSGNSNLNNTGPDDHKKPNDCPQPMAMARYSIHLLLASLSVTDSPVSYPVSYGPEVRVDVTYNQREAGQPATLDFTNFGPQWVSNWISYIEDNPSTPNANVQLHRRGGGGQTQSGYNTSTGQYAVQVDDGSTLTKLTANTYKQTFPDGSENYYEQFIGTTGPLRRVFLSRVRDPQGNQVAIEYDAVFPARIKRIVDASGLPTVFQYNQSGQNYVVTGILDPYGRLSTFVYSTASGALRLQSTQDPAGIISAFTYNAAGEMVALETPYGSTTFSLSPLMFLQPPMFIRYIEIVDPNGDRERVEYNLSTSLTGTSPTLETPTPSAALVSFVNSDQDDRDTYYWDKQAMRLAPGVYSKAHLYHWLQPTTADSATSILESERSPFESRVFYNYPGQTAPYIQGSLARPSVVARVIQDSAGTYSTQANLTQYTSSGLPTKLTDSLGRETTISYATNGVDLSVIQQKISAAAYGTLLAYGYDGTYPPHRPKTLTDAAGKTTTYTYVAATGQLSTVTNPNAEVITLNYGTNTASTSYRRVVSVTGDVPGGSRSMTYDSAGRVRTVTDSEGYTQRFDYDSLDRVRKVTFPDGSFEQYEYADHSLVASRDRAGRWTRHAYNALGQRVLTRDPAGHLTQYQWWQCGKLRRLVDGAGNATEWTRDIQGRVTRKSYADGSHEDYAYDFSGRLLTETDPMGRTKTHQYALDDRQTKLDYSDASTPDVTWTYDTYFPRATTRVDGIGTTSYVYNPLDGVTLGAGQVARINGPFPDDTLKYTYDSLGRVKKLEVVDDATYTTATLSEDLTFDAKGRVSSLTNNLGTFAYAYMGASNRVDTIDYPNGMRVDYGYFGTTTDFLLSQIKNLSSGTTPTVISQFDYTYNPDRTIATWAQKQGSAAATTWTFAYDALQQLTGAIRRDGSNNVLENERYGFDAAGNRTEVQTGTTTVNYAVNNLNQLRSARGFGGTTFAGTLDEAATVTLNGQSVPVVSTDGGTPYRFEGKLNLPAGSNTVTVQAVDGRGNTRTNHYGVTTTGTAALYEYDGDGNLRFEKTAAGVTTREYRWDAQDRLVRIVQGTHESVFDYDGQSRRVRIRELDSSVETSNKVYLWCGWRICQRRASNGSTVERSYFPQGFRESGTNYFSTKDHLLSLRDVVASNGTTIGSAMEYSPWGTRKQVAGSGATSEMGYTAHYAHAASGLALPRYRAYSSSKGRWLSRDPLGEADGPNVLEYVGNRPSSTIDPSGLLRSGNPNIQAAAAAIRDSLRNDPHRQCVCNQEYWNQLDYYLQPGFGPEVVPVENMLPENDALGLFDEQQPNTILVDAAEVKLAPHLLQQTLLHELQHWAEYWRTGGVSGDDTGRTRIIADYCRAH
ncbi:MAG: RHS repeat-associated core domain-containing protein [Myxococcota bacterium]